MAYTLGNKCAKNLCKRTVLLQLIIENVVTCFFCNTVYICIYTVLLLVISVPKIFVNGQFYKKMWSRFFGNTVYILYGTEIYANTYLHIWIGAKNQNQRQRSHVIDFTMYTVGLICCL